MSIVNPLWGAPRDSRRTPEIGNLGKSVNCCQIHAPAATAAVANVADLPYIKADTLVAKITPALIEDVKLRRAHDVAHSTVDKDLAVLKAFFNWCIARSLAASNPVCRVKFFNEDNSRLRYLTEDEYRRLIEAAKTIEGSPFLAEKIILAVHTGLRRGSLFNLRWDHVDFLNRVVRIPRTKSGRPHAVPLNATVLTTLQTLYTERVPDCPYVFAIRRVV
jgi:integrase